MQTKLNASLAALAALTVAILVVGIFAGESEKPLVQTELTIHELMIRQDSVFSIINDRYQEIKPIFQHSCFDCHSDNTDYPWYHKLPVIKGILDEHIAEGREYLDFSHDFPFSGKDSPLELLSEIKNEIEEDEMPLLSYRILHWGKLIEGARRDSVFQWIDSATSMLSEFYDQHGVEPED